eukprot:4183601-Pyramimonas_sp.AAC.1
MTLALCTCRSQSVSQSVSWTVSHTVSQTGSQAGSRSARRSGSRGYVIARPQRRTCATRGSGGGLEGSLERDSPSAPDTSVWAEEHTHAHGGARGFTCAVVTGRRCGAERSATQRIATLATSALVATPGLSRS